MLLRVDGVAVEIGEIIAQLDALHAGALADLLVTGAVIRQELAADPVHLTAAELQEAMERLLECVAADRIEDYFARHRDDLDVARIWRVTFGHARDAARAATAIRAGADLQPALEYVFAHGAGPGPTGRFEAVRRDELPDAMATAVFGAAPGTILGPFADGDDHELVKVLNVVSAALDADTTRLIGKRLFAGWLERRVARARMEWLWQGSRP